MVLRLKTRESRSLPGLPRGEGHASRSLLHDFRPKAAARPAAAFLFRGPRRARVRLVIAQIRLSAHVSLADPGCPRSSRRGVPRRARSPPDRRSSCLPSALRRCAAGWPITREVRWRHEPRLVAPACAGPVPVPAHGSSAFIDGETVALDDGRELRLIGALAPRAIDVGAEPGTWPLEIAAQAESRTLLARTSRSSSPSAASAPTVRPAAAHAFCSKAAGGAGCKVICWSRGSPAPTYRPATVHARTELARGRASRRRPAAASGGTRPTR